MRILAITNLYPNPYQPNRAPFNRQQFEALAAQHELRIIAPIAWTDELAAKWASRDRTQSRIESNGVTIEHPRYWFPPKILRGWYGHCFKRSIRNHFRRAVEEFRPEFVLAAWAYPDGWAAVELAHEVGLPVAVKVHGSDVLLLDQSKARRKRTIEALKRANLVIVVSKHLARAVIAMGVDAERVSVVCNGVDCDLFSPGSRQAARKLLGLPGVVEHGRENQKSPTPLLLFVGNLVAVKGPDVLVEACALLARCSVNFECRMIGQGPMHRVLERKIREAGLPQCVRLIGSRPLEEMPHWYRAADVVILPSRSEGLPNVLMEANACGARMIASRVGGIPEVTQNGGLVLVPPNDATALAAAIEHTLVQDLPDIAAPLQTRSWNASAMLLASVLERAALRTYKKRAA